MPWPGGCWAWSRSRADGPSPSRSSTTWTTTPSFTRSFVSTSSAGCAFPQKNADAQLRLAAWCLDNGLKDEAMAHYHVVTGLDPSRDIAWLRLGYKKHHDRWIKPEDLAAQKHEADRQKHADTQWRSRLEKLHDALESSIATRRLKAEKELYQITDPRAVPMIWQVFGSGSEPIQLAAVALFSQIEGPAASFCLALMAINNSSADVRERAVRALQFRDPRDLIGRLIALIHKPYNYEVKPATTPGAPGLLFVDGERFDLRRFYRFPEFDTRLIPKLDIDLSTCPTEAPGNDQKSINAMIKEAYMLRAVAAVQNTVAVAQAMEATQTRIAALERGIVDDVQRIEETNAQINETNGRVLPILESLTGQKIGVDQVAWQKWWSGQLGYVYNDRYTDNKASLSEIVDVPEIELPLPIVNVNATVRHSCFAAGTLVTTLSGPRKIESIAVGDRVLSQHTTLGRAFIPARSGDTPDRSCRNVPDLTRRRNDRRHRHPPLLEGRQGLDHGARPESRRSPPHARRPRDHRLDRARRHPDGL